MSHLHARLIARTERVLRREAEAPEHQAAVEALRLEVQKCEQESLEAQEAYLIERHNFRAARQALQCARLLRQPTEALEGSFSLAQQIQIAAAATYRLCQEKRRNAVKAHRRAAISAERRDRTTSKMRATLETMRDKVLGETHNPENWRGSHENAVPRSVKGLGRWKSWRGLDDRAHKTDALDV